MKKFVKKLVVIACSVVMLFSMAVSANAEKVIDKQTIFSVFPLPHPANSKPNEDHSVDRRLVVGKYTGADSNVINYNNYYTDGQMNVEMSFTMPANKPDGWIQVDCGLVKLGSGLFDTNKVLCKSFPCKIRFKKSSKAQSYTRHVAFCGPESSNGTKGSTTFKLEKGARYCVGFNLRNSERHSLAYDGIKVNAVANLKFIKYKSVKLSTK